MIADPVPSAVLDTNVLLDWLLFADPVSRELAASITDARLGWCACPAMRSEFDQVLGRPGLQAWKPDANAAAIAWSAHARMQAEPPACRLRCGDPDDQVFLDLAMAQRCRWLISRDRALLELRRQAAPSGLSIVTPQAWLAEWRVFAPSCTAATP